MDHLTQQRIQYLVENGAIPMDEPASRDFVMKWGSWLLGLNIAEVVLLAAYCMSHLR